MGESHLVKKPVIRHVLIKSGCIHKKQSQPGIAMAVRKSKDVMDLNR